MCDGYNNRQTRSKNGSERLKMKENKLKAELRKHIEKCFGKRCKKYCVGCPTCEAWGAYYTIFNCDDEEEIGWERHLDRKKKISDSLKQHEKMYNRRAEKINERGWVKSPKELKKKRNEK